MKKIFTLLVICSFVLLSVKTFSQSEYQGTVRYIDAARTPVSSVTVKLYDASGHLVATDLTNGKGKYVFSNIPNGSYTIKFSGYTNGARYDARNAFLIAMNLAGVVQFTPLQKLAADINGNGKVDRGDLQALVVDYFLNGKKGSIGKLVAIPKQIQIGGNSLKDDHDDDIGGSGDPDGSFLPTTKARINNYKIKYLKGISVRANQSLAVPVYYNSNLSLNGFALSMDYPEDAMNFEQLTSSLQGVEFSNFNGKIKVSWQNTSGVSNIDVSEPIFVLKFSTASSDNDINELNNITFNPESQFIDVNGTLIEDVQLSIPKLIGSEGENTLHNIYPNPIYNTAKINYTLSGNYKVNLNVYNTVGQLVTTLVNEDQTAGSYEVSFNRANLHLSAGSYIYRLECEGENSFVQSKIMIIR